MLQRVLGHRCFALRTEVCHLFVSSDPQAPAVIEVLEAMKSEPDLEQAPQSIHL